MITQINKQNYINILNINKDKLNSLLIPKLGEKSSLYLFEIDNFKLNIEIDNFSSRGFAYIIENGKYLYYLDKRFENFLPEKTSSVLIIKFNNIDNLYNLINYINRLSNLSTFS